MPKYFDNEEKTDHKQAESIRYWLTEEQFKAFPPNKSLSPPSVVLTANTVEISGWQFPGQPQRSRAAIESELECGR